MKLVQLPTKAEVSQFHKRDGGGRVISTYQSKEEEDPLRMSEKIVVCGGQASGRLLPRLRHSAGTPVVLYHTTIMFQYT